MIAREKSEILVEYLHKVFCERGHGMNLKTELQLSEAQESRGSPENAVLQIEQEVENVLKHAKLDKEEETPKQEEASSGSDKKENKKASGKGKQEKKSFDKKGHGGDFRGGFRRDSNPDVIYGRDFEGETIPLENITGEMGEVIIRGQVLDVEAREIRNENHSYFSGYGFYRLYCDQNVPSERAGFEVKKEIKRSLSEAEGYHH